MTHQFDIAKEVRLHAARKSTTHVGVLKCRRLYELVLDAYPLEVARGLINPELYYPVDETDETEAAIFATAWNVGSRKLIKRFGRDAVVSLFDRYTCSTLLDGLPDGHSKITIFRGTKKSDITEYETAMSWTSSLEIARLFANSNNYSEPTIVTGEIDRANILMAVRGDEEQEYVVRPRSFRTTSVNLA